MGGILIYPGSAINVRAWVRTTVMSPQRPEQFPAVA
jgi:hypothetical protein